MLELNNIVKIYEVGDQKVTALNHVSMTFRDNEFVSILGPSGCGKTTLLNIIGGLDKYTEGDLIINEVSTKKYRDADWDSYRNHKIGFVFQSYNLIPHQNILSNVELALTLSGVSRKERRRRAIEALDRVGLHDHLRKKPNQLSGGQMQRVAIARALVNNPDILLADEPTGALDTETSTQVMDILAEVAKDRLVIMVTHNPELAMMYSTRIIRLLDGQVQSDSMPVEEGSKAALAEDGSAKSDIAISSKNAPAYWQSESAKEEISPLGSDIEKAFSNAAEGPSADSDGFTEKNSTENGSSKKAAKKAARQASKKASDKKAKRPPKTSMKLTTALSLSLNNLMTKKARTLLTAFAGSIGIIGIALILSLSNGVQLYIDSVEEDTLSSYPITIEQQSIDMTSFMTTMQDVADSSEEHEDGYIYTTEIMTKFMSLMVNEISTNNLADFKKYIENNHELFDDLVTDIQYSYSTQMNIYRADTGNGVVQVNPGQVFSSMGMSSNAMASSFTSSDVWVRLIDNEELLEEQYEVIYGRMPEAYDELVLMVSGDNEVTDYTLYTLGIMDSDELTEAFGKMLMGDEEAQLPECRSYSYDELTSIKFKLLLNTDYYEKQDGVWTDMSDDELYMIDKLNSSGIELKIVGILRSDSDAAMSNLAGTIGYRTDLQEYLIDQINSSEIVQEQLADPDTDVFTGLPFEKDSDEEETLTMEDLNAYLSTLSADEQAKYTESIQQMKDYGMSDESILEAFQSAMEAQTSDSSYDSNLSKLGVADLDDPSAINLYPKDFESKDSLTDLISDYNAGVSEEEQISYTDYVGLIMSSVTTIINAISYILIAFVAISLIVSSIMIGIITYISVLERTKEIGILRAIGASKKDISRVFNAETLLIGFTAGAMGILISELLLIPINAIIYNITDISGIAVLPVNAAVILVFISMFLTFIAGLFPSRIAAKKDPVVALRTE